MLSKNNRIYYYHGDWGSFRDKPNISNKLFSKEWCWKVIREKQHWLDISNTEEGRDGLMLLIKVGEEAIYCNVIDMLDETLINDVKKYTVLKPQEEKIKYLEKGKNNKKIFTYKGFVFQ